MRRLSKPINAFITVMAVIFIFLLIFASLKWDFFGELAMLSVMIGIVTTFAVWEIGAIFVVIWDHFLGKNG